MAPTEMKQWTINGQNGLDSLTYQEKVPVPKLGDKDVLVKLHAASLNFRDLAIPKGMYPFPVRDGVVPTSDGAGEVVAVGERVSRFKVGDKVATLFNQSHIAGPLDGNSIKTGLGGVLDGCLRQYGAFDEQGLVAVPANLNWLEASTLSCAALTAWNALYGLEGRPLKQGDYVLTQGTGGVSIFALQFAKAAGAKVIATTSTKEKAEFLKKLGADHVINYKEDPAWGSSAKKLTPDERGLNFVVEVGGPKTMKQSLACIGVDGIVTIIGFIAGQGEEEPSYLDALIHLCTVRGIFVGSRQQFEDMNRAIQANDIHPVVDKQVFSLEQSKDAYQYMLDQKHIGKICIKIE
ncbi:uncharacterized protein K452DRAFT_267952 [Aplosporella prunicola CBS 121167]|uniref:Enoyl reductase (ER) domain-containing protein n=1 Tax=Aplosporella prunicola CBS 121167 TaxID=1176127 RepID=A0A6A6BHP4_9PEZI|nr:uncharacterized protein K452DRAFT_267952 [Aplosporella prunicola CBS 121167]KAF2143669.1 hypothetical protein K452DRAFT_267952 [Aplosporella prunicola CBS 121167]